MNVPCIQRIWWESWWFLAFVSFGNCGYSSLVIGSPPPHGSLFLSALMGFTIVWTDWYSVDNSNTWCRFLELFFDAVPSSPYYALQILPSLSSPYSNFCFFNLVRYLSSVLFPPHLVLWSGSCERQKSGLICLLTFFGFHFLSHYSCTLLVAQS